MQRQLEAVQARLAEAEEALRRQGHEWQARERQLEAASAAAAMEVGVVRAGRGRAPGGDCAAIIVWRAAQIPVGK